MAKINAVHKAFINQCDEKDGLKDGIVSDPNIAISILESSSARNKPATTA